MIIRLFDIQDKVVVPTEHCYNLKFLKRIMEEYPLEYMKVYSYLFYMTCPDPDSNPFFYVLEEEKEEMILEELGAEFSTEEDCIVEALDRCRRLYETPISRAFVGVQVMLDNISKYLKTTIPEHGRDGNITALMSIAKNFNAIRESFKGAYKDLKEEQTSVRGDQRLSYDS